MHDPDNKKKLFLRQTVRKSSISKVTNNGGLKTATIHSPIRQKHYRLVYSEEKGNGEHRNDWKDQR